MRFVSRKEWLARRAKGSQEMPDAPDGVAFHWEGPKMGPFVHAKCARKVRGIQDFHMDDRGWNDIAYSAVVCPHGYVFEGRGRYRTAANGTDYGNDNYLAVCYLGGEHDGFTNEGKIGMMNARSWLRGLTGAGDKIKVHRNFKSTTCPGPDVSSWVKAGCPLPPGTVPAVKPIVVPDPPTKETKVYFVVSDPRTHTDWGTDMMTKFPFPSQSAKNEWVTKTGATRTTLPTDLFDAIPEVSR